MKRRFTNRLVSPQSYKATHVLSGKGVNSACVYVGFRVDDETQVVLDAKWWVSGIAIEEADWIQTSYDVIGCSLSESEQRYWRLLDLV